MACTIWSSSEPFLLPLAAAAAAAAATCSHFCFLPLCMHGVWRASDSCDSRLCRFMSIPSNVGACRFRFMFMPTRFNIDIDYCRFLPMSKHVDPMSTLSIVDLYRCRFWSMSTHVDDGSSRCRQLLLSTLSAWSGAVNPVDSRNL